MGFLKKTKAPVSGDLMQRRKRRAWGARLGARGFWLRLVCQAPASQWPRINLRCVQSSRLSYRVIQTGAFAEASPKPQNPRFAVLHHFGQCSNTISSLGLH